MPILNMIAQGGGGGSNVGEPTNISASATSGTSVDIKWTDNNLQAIPPSTFQKSVLVRKVGSAPTTPSDGTTVVTETVMNTYQSSAYSDTGLTDGTTYYYQVFSYSTDGGITYGTPVSATPSSQWQPGVNTIAYYPLTTSTQLLDQSGNGYDLSKIGTGTTTFGTYGGVDCVYINSNAMFQASIGSGVSATAGITMNARYYSYQTPLYDNGTVVAFSAIDQEFSNDNRTTSILHCNGRPDGRYGLTGFINDANGAGITQTMSISNGIWYNVCFVYSGTTGTLYVNGNSIGTVTYANAQDTQYYVKIGNKLQSFDRSIRGYVSEAIFEDKSRTAQEIADYYDQTKGDYGIS